MIKVCRQAALKGRTDVLECAVTFGITYSEMVGEGIFLMKKFAKEGNLEIMKYFGYKLNFVERDWQNLFDKAAKYDRLNIMKWICRKTSYESYSDDYENYGEPSYMQSTIEVYELVFESRTINLTAPRVSDHLCKEAAECGNIQVLEYCHRNNYQFDHGWLAVFNDLCSSAVDNKDKEQALVTLKWLYHHGCPWSENFSKTAVCNDNLEALKWARNNGCSWDESTLQIAAHGGNIAMIEYCLQNECPMNTLVCASAMLLKDNDRALEVLKLLRKYSCPWDQYTIQFAINNGNFEAMLWAKRNGCSWSECNFELLVGKGDVSIIEEVLKDEPRQESPMMQNRRGAEKVLKDTAEIFRTALSNDTSSDSLIIEKLKLFRKYGYQWDAQITALAAEHGRLLALQWLWHIGCPMDESACVGAVRSGNIEILKYAHEVAGCGLNKEAYVYCFGEYGLDQLSSCIPTRVRDSHSEILKYLEKNDCPKPKKSD